jgi:Protein of unknown function (DUF1553)/Protein of unknown function (DUF1549)/Planctomycete cytochrome C
MRGFLLSGFTLLFSVLSPVAAESPRSPRGVDNAFFEAKIRPVLVRHCYECHSSESKKVRGGLRLDSRDALLKGGDSGPALVPGKPTESLILKALRHDEIAMPPKEKLPASVAADFERWIQGGAPDPRISATTTAKSGIDIQAGRAFWAFTPPQRYNPPAVRDMSWPRTDIDRFLLAAMEAKGVRPVRDADSVTLLRRVHIALVGLPPTPQETDAFLADHSPEALARVVDRLLASPGFGERWGRHWLDLARYADSNGKDENLTFHEAWRYRDFVIDAVNRDIPFDRFLALQLAGDLLPAATDAERDLGLTATGFLVLGPKVLANRDILQRKMDVVDEQIDTVGRVFLGLTLGCARCHDHKFDPVPTRDYHALAGIFASTHTLDGFKLGNPVVSGWSVRPLGGAAGDRLQTAALEYQKKVKANADSLKKVRADLKTLQDATPAKSTRLAGIVVDDVDAKKVGFWKPSTYAKPYIGTGYLSDDKSGKGEKSITFTPTIPAAGEYEVLVSYTSGGGRSTNTPVKIHFLDGEKTILVDQSKPPSIDGQFCSVGTYRFEAGASGSVVISNTGTTGYVIVDAVRFVPVGAAKTVVKETVEFPSSMQKKINAAKAKVAELEKEEATLKASAPPAPTLVMAVRDEPKPGDVSIAVRGDPHRLGAVAPRGFLSVVDSPSPKIAEGHSGRAELARWMTDPKNPLTARVFVNRAWMHLFGEGLVRTVDNFGVQGEKPSHPELLDALAIRFVEEGWSTKRLIRTLILSRAYGLSCTRDPAAERIDPENRLHWRANRSRLEAEVIRDSVLLVSGQLDRTMGRSSVAKLGEQAINNNSVGGLSQELNNRRSVYLPILRNDLPTILEVFDFADPDTTTGKRDATTVATQALFLMNSPFVMEQAKETAHRLMETAGDEARVELLYRLALNRRPTSLERERVLHFVRSGSSGRDAWARVCQAVFGCTEFRFVE